eukprot:scaffold3065_cov389-Prasinococcus_capsulatus_cf.AAC.17
MSRRAGSGDKRSEGPYYNPAQMGYSGGGMYGPGPSDQFNHGSGQPPYAGGPMVMHPAMYMPMQPAGESGLQFSPTPINVGGIRMCLSSYTRLKHAVCFPLS